MTVNGHTKQKSFEIQYDPILCYSMNAFIVHLRRDVTGHKSWLWISYDDRLRKPSILFALHEIIFTCLFHLRSSVMNMPIIFVWLTGELSTEYCMLIGSRDLVM